MHSCTTLSHWYEIEIEICLVEFLTPFAIDVLCQMFAIYNLVPVSGKILTNNFFKHYYIYYHQSESDLHGIIHGKQVIDDCSS